MRCSNAEAAIFMFQEYQEYLQMEKQLLEELGIRDESDHPDEV